MTEERTSDRSLGWFQLVLDYLPQTIFWKDLNSRYLGCDCDFARIAGAESPEELIGKNDYDMPWTKEESDWYIECDRRVIASNTPEYGILETQVNAEGQLTWLETNKIPLHDQDGNVVGILGTFEDVTERQLAEEKIKQSLRKLSDFQSALTRSAIVSIMDTEGTFIYVNDRFCEISQYTRSELLGKTCRAVASDYHSPEFWQHQWATISSGEIWQGEIYKRAKGGSGYWVNATIIPSLDKDDRPVQYLEILQDISERKKAQAALEYQLKKTNLLHQLTQAIHRSLDTQAIFQTTTEQIRQFLNLDCVGIFQLTQNTNTTVDRSGRLIASDAVELSSWRDRLSECCFDYRQREVMAIADTQIADLSQTQRDWLISRNIRAYLAVPLLQGDNLWGWLCIYQSDYPRLWDTAEIEFVREIATQLSIALYQAQLLAQEKQQRQLLDRQNQQLRQANIAKSSFLANMSHELRTPLNIILGFSQVMYRDVSLTAEQQDTLQIINQSGEHLLSLINDVLEVAKIEAGKTSLKIDSFDLYDFLDSIKKMLSLKAQELGIELVFERSPDVPRYIASDRGKVRQILINLLGNALKFTPQGEVRLKTQTISKDKNKELQFIVTDTGIGIKPTEIDCLFAPFVQTESGIKSQQGTGLGLSIGRKFARLMEGDITVASKYGSGSTFCFTLPVTTVSLFNHIEQHQRAIGLAPGQPQYRILLADDKVENRLLLNRLLVPLGFITEEAANGRECLELWSNWQPDLILMDIQMPLMNGIDATVAIKEQSNSIPIIALTASAFAENKAEILAAGCDNFLTKPIKAALLYETIANHLPLTYIYESTLASSLVEPADQMEVLDLSFMSPEWLKKVHRATSQLDDRLLLELIAEIPHSHSVVREALARKVVNFDFDVILELIS